MPTADASQFTQLKKYRAVQNRGLITSKKVITHLYQPLPTATGLVDFLPSFSNKQTSTLIITRPNHPTAPKSKTGATPQINV
jgi:hypothetical protein